MDNYVLQKRLGKGSHGTVWLALCKRSQDKVAIKQVNEKFRSLESCQRFGEYVIYRDIFQTRKLNHPNVVRMREAFLLDEHLYFVFDFLPQSLYKLIQTQGRTFTDREVQKVTRQILQGLKFINSQGFFHRDIKPENILCNGVESVKISDFGEARRIKSCQPYTANVSTRWYRAPELLLCADYYSSSVDIWAVGCIIAELHTLKPLFPGRTEIEQMAMISSFLGTPSLVEWREGWDLASAKNLTWQSCQPVDIRLQFPRASEETLDILKLMLAWDPLSRPTAVGCLKHPAFARCRDPARPESVVEGRQHHAVRGAKPPNGHQGGVGLDSTVDARLKTTDLDWLKKRRGVLGKERHAGAESREDGMPLGVRNKPSEKNSIDQERSLMRETGNEELETYINALQERVKENQNMIKELISERSQLEAEKSNQRALKATQKARGRRRRDVASKGGMGRKKKPY